VPPRSVRVIAGDPDMSRVATSCVERQNLTMRVGMRHLTQLTNGFPKRDEESRVRHEIPLHALQFRSAPPDADQEDRKVDYSGDGCWQVGPCLVDSRNCGTAKLVGPSFLMIFHRFRITGRPLGFRSHEHYHPKTSSTIEEG
jgi:hypothetical protein